MLLSSSSQYFKFLFSGSYAPNQTISLPLPKNYSVVVVNILLNFAMMGVTVVPEELTTESWMELA